MRNLLFLLMINCTFHVNAQNISYIWGMHFPALTDPSEVCCFDYDNDGTLDDGLGYFLITLQAQSTSNFQDGINQGILDNSIVKVFDWQNFDIFQTNQTFTFQYLDAQINNPNLTLQQRMNGFAEISVPAGQNNNFFSAINNSGSVTATASQVSGLLNLQFDAQQGLVPLTINTVKVNTTLMKNPIGKEDGIYTEDFPATNPTVVGGMKIGGILPSDEFLGVLDSQYRTCGCASVDPNQPLITTSIFLGTIIVSCAQSGLTPENCPIGSFCSSVNDFCSNAIGIGTTFDIDENNDGVNDAYSVALRYGASASSNGIIYINGFE
jgi:hypothetical protein